MKMRRHSTGYLFGLALALVSLASAAMAQGVAPKQNGKIAFSDFSWDFINRHEHLGISVMNPDGSGRSQLTSTKTVCPQPNRPPGTCGPDHGDDSPSWSPDGKQIAFVRSVPAPGFRYDTEFFVMNADGSNQQQLTQSLSIDSSSHPTWSPDGAKIAFAVGQDVWVMNADGSGATIISPSVGYYSASSEPAWSPDGSRLAVVRYDGIYLINIDGSNRTQITAPKNPSPKLGDYDLGPAWSPDGTRILFIRRVGCDGEENCESVTIWTVNADGSNPAKLADIAAYGCLAWSPDGTKIVFRWWGWADHGDVDRDQDLFTIDADGSNVTRLTNTPGELESEPSWQPVALAPPPVNPIDDPQFFVRQHYRDFLNREPDAGGLAYWTNRITECGSDARCIHERLIGVSAAFFIELEFQDTGYYVYRFYKASFGRQPTFPEFTADRTKVIGGSNLEASKQAFADEWVQRQSFRDAYPITMSNTEVVNKLFDSAGLTSSIYDAQRQQEILAMNAGRSRALVLRDVIEIPDFKNIPDPNDPRYSELKQVSQYNPAFVLMQYFGYLRRNVDQNGYNFWLDVVNNREPNNYHGMVCAFITSSEYQFRFGSLLTRSNADCGR